MEEMFQIILERIEFDRKEQFNKLLFKSIHVSKDSTKSTYAIHDNLVFKVGAFFAGFRDFQNFFDKDKKYLAGVHALTIICEELGFDIAPEECFIIYHIRELGKFRIKETTLHSELKELWCRKVYKPFELSDQDFSSALKSLMRMKFIDYRKGNLNFNPAVIVRYKTGASSN